jgi:hypothetical protein
MGLTAGILGIILILAVLGLGWHVIWDGMIKGLGVVRQAVVSISEYFLSSYRASSAQENNPSLHATPEKNHYKL